MKFLKKYWYLLMLTIITAGMGVVALVTSGKLTTTTPVAPNVPQVTPQAAAPACTLTFNLATPTPTTPGNTNTPTQTPTETPTGAPGNTPTATPTGAPGNTPTPTPNLASCNNTCSVNSDCQGGLVCNQGFCRNGSCTDKTNCTCEVAQATPKTPIAGTGPSVLGASVIGSGLLLILLGLAL